MFEIEFENGQVKRFENPVKINDLIDDQNYNYFACKINNKLRDFEYVINRNCMIKFLDNTDSDASKVYESSLRFVLLMAAYRVDKSLALISSYYVSRSVVFRRKDGEKIDKETYDLVEKEMKNIIDCDYKFTRHNLTKEKTMEVLKKFNYEDKIALMKYRPEDGVHMYYCEEYCNYLYSYLTPSSGYLKDYKLLYKDGEIVLMYPRSELRGKIPEFKEEETYEKTLKEAREWNKANSTSTVQEINEHIENGDAQQFVLTCENKHNRMLDELAKKIADNPKIALIAIAGPSSSGKTTFSNRLKIKLLEKGINPVVISMDDYYIDRDLFDFDSVTDFEDINLLDLPLFNKHMKELIEGKEVEIPRFDFVTKKRKPGKKIKLDKNTPIVIEGIHALNKKTTELVPDDRKFKIYIGPQIQVNLDDHNPISITHLRLIRRIVRDNQFRDSSAEYTLSMWESVRNGEFKWIYDNQEGVDFVFNSALDYEFCVTKKHVLPLLKEVKQDSPYYNLASSVKKYLKYFQDIDDDKVPSNSLLREFIGGSCFSS